MPLILPFPWLTLVPGPPGVGPLGSPRPPTCSSPTCRIVSKQRVVRRVEDEEIWPRRSPPAPGFCTQVNSPFNSLTDKLDLSASILWSLALEVLGGLLCKHGLFSEHLLALLLCVYLTWGKSFTSGRASISSFQNGITGIHEHITAKGLAECQAYNKCLIHFEPLSSASVSPDS